MSEFKLQAPSDLGDQVRQKLLLKLKQKKNQQNDQNYSKRINISTIAEYLRLNNLNYSYEVLLSESGLKFISSEELRVALQVENPKGPILEHLINQPSQHSFIHQEKTVTSDQQTQTGKGDYILSLEYKLNSVVCEQPKVEMEEQLYKLRKQYDEKLKKQLKEETQRVRNHEENAIRQEIEEYYRKKMDDYCYRMEQEYKEKLNKLREKEKLEADKAQKKIQEIENKRDEFEKKCKENEKKIKEQEDNLYKQSLLSQDDINKNRKKLMEQESEQRRIMLEQETFIQNQKDELKQLKEDMEKQQFIERQELLNRQRVIDQQKEEIIKLKSTVQMLDLEVKQLDQEKQDKDDLIIQTKRLKRDMENETAHFRNQNMIMTEINKRDTETIEKLEFEILQAQNKLQIYKNTFQHKDELIVDYKTLHNEEAKKLNRIIKEQENQIQHLNNEMKKLEEKLFQKENLDPEIKIVKQAQETGVPIVESLIFGYDCNQHKNRIRLINNELEENRQKRQQEIRLLMGENVEDGKDYFSQLK